VQPLLISFVSPYSYPLPIATKYVLYLYYVLRTTCFMRVLPVPSTVLLFFEVLLRKLRKYTYYLPTYLSTYDDDGGQRKNCR